MANKYPWYEVVEGTDLEQGDLLRACPVIRPDPGLTFPFPDDNISVLVDTFDVVVMTQSCDLVNEKVMEVILCPHWDLDAAGKMDSSLAKKNSHQEILKGRLHRYAMLAASNISELPMGIRIVDLGRIFSLPKAFISQFSRHQGKRLRLCPPYREHLSQAFARFFMRVGLPQNIELPK